MDRKKIRTLISFSIKIGILLLTFGYIYKQIFQGSGAGEIRQTYQLMVSQPYSISLFIVVFLLMFVNWGLESTKWRLMIYHIEKISFFRSIEAVFSGVTVSLFTPNRIGEYGGRVFYLDPEHRIQAVFITILTSMSQLLITIIMGIGGLVYFLPRLTEINAYLYYSIVVIGAGLLIGLLFFYFNIYLINIFLLKIKWLRKAEKYIHVLMEYTSAELLRVLLLSFVRYLVFAVQFYILLVFYKVKIPIFEGLMMISLAFFIMSVIPTFTLSELGIRGSVSLYFIGVLSSNTVGILAASFTLWLINLVIPAVIGAFLIFNVKLFRQR